VAISLRDEKAFIDPEKCVGCGECLLICQKKAIDIRWNADIPLFQKKMVEYTLGALKGKKGSSAFLNFLTQISPNREMALETSCLTTHKEAGEDKFKGLYPKIDWTVQLDYAEKIGLGNREYELINV
jgi:uncharacterized Fe-S center protein